MSRLVTNPSTNEVTIVGTLLDVTMREGISKASGKPYRAGTAVIRVNQSYGGKNEVSEVPVNFLATKFKKDGTANPAYESVAQFSTQFKSAKNYALNEASRIRINGRSGNLSENMFCSQNNPETVISNWRINASFFNEVRGEAVDCATFKTDLFIMNMEREINRAGEETGRLKIRGGIVQYGGRLDTADFFVEDPTSVDYIERNYNVNDTVNVVGRVRYTSETVELNKSNSWGEDIPETSTQTKHELIITAGCDEPFEEELAYSPEDIRTLNQDRNNRKEQAKIDARNRTQSKAATAKPATTETSGYGWE